MLAALLAATTLTAPADSGSWQQYPCPGGGLDAGMATAMPRNSGAILVTVPGEVECGVKEPGPQFAVAVFTPNSGSGAIYRPETMLAYAHPEGPTTFRLLGNVSDGLVVGLCLMTDEMTRLSCILVKRRSDAVQVSGLATTDPLVSGPVQLVPGGYGPEPACAGCWSLTP
jgi:hypothetical protein